MSIVDQIAKSQLSNRDQTGGLPANNKVSMNYDNTSITTKGQGEIITQIEPLQQSNLAPTSATTDDKYITTIFNESLE